MARFELSITENYAPSWGVWEGLREVMQNGLDGEYSGYPLSVTYENGMLKVTNIHCVLDRSVWLLGKTTKRGDSNFRGQHGDGLKVGVLALLRERVPVRIYNGDEIWTPSLEYSENYSGERVLVIRTRKRRRDEYGDRKESYFSVCVGVSKTAWNLYKQRFLRFATLSEDEFVSTPHGSILTSPDMAGKIFVKGIFVCEKPDLDYGYDLTNVTLDRDRRMISDWDLQYEIAFMVKYACAENSAWTDKVYNSLMEGRKDFSYVEKINNAELHQAIANKFVEQYGEKAVPARTNEEANKVSFYALDGVVVPPEAYRVFEHVYGPLDTVIKRAIEDSGKKVSLYDLTPEEQEVWKKAIVLLDLADIAPTSYLRHNVVCYEYTTPEAPLGMHFPTEERINRKVLSSLTKTLSVMIHELAHKYGKDGTLAHRSAEESIWEKVTEVILDLVGTDWLLN